mgnify:CR=1 FL=1
MCLNKKSKALCFFIPCVFIRKNFKNTNKIKKTTEFKKEKEVTLLVDKWDEALLKYIEFRDAGFDPDKIVESLRKKYEVANEEELNNFLADANKKSK